MIVHDAEIEKAKTLGRLRGSVRWIVRMHDINLPIDNDDWNDLRKCLADYEAADEAFVAAIRARIPVGAEP